MLVVKNHWVVMGCLLGAPGLVAADATLDSLDKFGASLRDSVANSSINLGFRYRFESVEDDAFDRDATANTLRSRLTVAPRPIGPFSLLLEVDDVRQIGNDAFNDQRNGNADRPAVIDPEGTDLNQAVVRFAGWTGGEINIGRMRIERNNQRFVGGVGWRQNEQTYDGAGIRQKFNDRLEGSYQYVSQVNRIQGPNNGTPPADLDSETHLVDLKYQWSPDLAVSGYWYLMDFSNSDALSNQTLGLRVAGGRQLADGLRLNLVGEYAYQEDHGDNPVSYDADYYAFEAGLAWSRIGVKVGVESLGGDAVAGKAFRTPLATLHAFQGWGDKFLTTPDRGILDTYVAVTGKALGADLVLRFHDFQAETGSQDWGTEVDFSANWPIGKYYAVLLKAATYDADDFAFDTDKYWLMLTANF